MPKLTAEDLKDLGVSLVGHRRLLLEAIAALRTDAVPAAGPPAVSSTSAAADHRSPGTGAERRHLTVMFCDLVGSTALVARLDVVGVHFGQPSYLADGILLRSWRSGPEKNQPKLPAAVRSMIERGLVELRSGQRGVRGFFTAAG